MERVFLLFFFNADSLNHHRPWKSESGEADASALLCFKISSGNFKHFPFLLRLWLIKVDTAGWKALFGMVSSEEDIGWDVTLPSSLLLLPGMVTELSEPSRLMRPS